MEKNSTKLSFAYDFKEVASRLQSDKVRCSRLQPLENWWRTRRKTEVEHLIKKNFLRQRRKNRFLGLGSKGLAVALKI